MLIDGSGGVFLNKMFLFVVDKEIKKCLPLRIYIFSCTIFQSLNNSDHLKSFSLKLSPFCSIILFIPNGLLVFPCHWELQRSLSWQQWAWVCFPFILPSLWDVCLKHVTPNAHSTGHTFSEQQIDTNIAVEPVWKVPSCVANRQCH